MNEIHGKSIHLLRDLIRRRELSCREVVSAFLQRIERMDEKVRAFLEVDPSSVLEQASELDRRIAGGDPSEQRLLGIPIALKDNISTLGLRTTAGSKILEGYVPPYDATVVRRLKSAGAIVLGKTNCDEFAMGSSTENSAYFETRNPWDLSRVPGGSSGGSAAAVASCEAPGALGSDTGGSIRQPAAFCGVVGMKPTYGRVSRYGLVAFGSSLDQIGPFANNVRDCALLLEAIGGPDPRDSTCSRSPQDSCQSEFDKDIRGLRLGVPREWFGSGLHHDVETSVKEAIRCLEMAGCLVEEVSLPNTEHAIATYYVLAPAEASSNLARYDGVKFGFRSAEYQDLSSMYRKTRTEGFGREVKRRIMVGTYVLSAGYIDAYYTKAAQVRRVIAQDYRKIFDRVDALIGPTTPTLPFRLGEKTGNPLEMYLSDVYTVTANLAGVPALAVPCGFSGDGLPIGVQLQGPHFSEGRLFRLGHALERDLGVVRPALPSE